MQAEFQAALEKEQSNTLPVTTFQADDLMEKLKLLNYEKQLLREMKMKPLSRFYFVKSTNPGEQFFMFTSICAWLIRKLGKHFDQPQEFDDPNQTIANIVGVLNEIVRIGNGGALKYLQSYGFPGYPHGFCIEQVNTRSRTDLLICSRLFGHASYENFKGMCSPFNLSSRSLSWIRILISTWMFAFRLASVTLS